MENNSNGYVRIEFKRGQFISLLVLLLLCAVSLKLDSETLTMSTSYPSPAGVYQSLITTTQATLARDSGNAFLVPPSNAAGNVGVGTTSPQFPNPKGGASGNLDAADVYLRSVSRWASQSAGGPTFINPVLIYTAAAGDASWTTFDASPYIPQGANGVVIEVQYPLGDGWPMYNPQYTIIQTRAGPSSLSIDLVRDYVYQPNGTANVLRRREFSPVAANRTFQFSLQEYCYPVNRYLTTMSLVGYY